MKRDENDNKKSADSAISSKNTTKLSYDGEEVGSGKRTYNNRCVCAVFSLSVWKTLERKRGFKC